MPSVFTASGDLKVILLTLILYLILLRLVELGTVLASLPKPGPGIPGLLPWLPVIVFVSMTTAYVLLYILKGQFFISQDQLDENCADTRKRVLCKESRWGSKTTYFHKIKSYIKIHLSKKKKAQNVTDALWVDVKELKQEVQDWGVSNSQHSGKLQNEVLTEMEDNIQSANSPRGWSPSQTGSSGRGASVGRNDSGEPAGGEAGGEPLHNVSKPRQKDRAHIEKTGISTPPNTANSFLEEELKFAQKKLKAILCTNSTLEEAINKLQMDYEALQASRAELVQELLQLWKEVESLNMVKDENLALKKLVTQLRCQLQETEQRLKAAEAKLAEAAELTQQKDGDLQDTPAKTDGPSRALSAQSIDTPARLLPEMMNGRKMTKNELSQGPDMVTGKPLCPSTNTVVYKETRMAEEVPLLP